MTDDSLLPFDLPAVSRKKLTVDFSGANQSSDGAARVIEHGEGITIHLPTSCPHAALFRLVALGPLLASP